MPAHVSWSRCLVLDRRSRSDCFLHQPGDLEDAHLVTARDVDAVADQLVRLGRHENASHRVADPGEVARLQAVAQYDQRLAGHRSHHHPPRSWKMRAGSLAAGLTLSRWGTSAGTTVV